MDNQHPGPQRKLKRNPFKYFPAYLLTACIALFIFTVLQSNLKFFGLNAQSALWQFALLDVKAAVTLLISVLTLLYTRSQFEHGLRPLLGYRVGRTAESVYNLGHSEHNDYIAVRLVNLGGGVAIIRRATHLLKMKDAAELPGLSFPQLTAQLKKEGFLQQEDYDLTFISKGWIIGSKEERVILEMDISDQDKKNNLRRIEKLDIELVFEGSLGDAYAKTLYCIPRRGIDKL
jgi:hypothetical protein